MELKSDPPFHLITSFFFFLFCMGVTLNAATLTMLQSQFLGPYRLTDRRNTKTSPCPHGLFTVSRGCIRYKLPFSRIWKVVCLNFCIRILSCKSIHISAINLHTLFKRDRRQTTATWLSPCSHFHSKKQVRKPELPTSPKLPGWPDTTSFLMDKCFNCQSGRENTFYPKWTNLLTLTCTNVTLKETNGSCHCRAPQIRQPEKGSLPLDAERGTAHQNA